MIHGKRTFTAYSIVESELEDLFALSIIAAGCWSMVEISIGFAVGYLIARATKGKVNNNA